ncbi:copper amine oxidase-like protein [Paenibacillus taihuensis]|uniref:Copper amine oxidase-like protein n=1 Tax=Paenibacillus taihuensis TaxID=1156355 RepID=A0A3D9RR41_9BACL|nr:cell wall hydrolase [Paenibacillus taihuensis]REE80191.1 copper amine oxidase-like protein [Paenibacillus taihuensis]
MIKAIKPANGLLLAMILGLLLSCTMPLAVAGAQEAGSDQAVSVQVNGKLVKLSERATIIDGRTYVPAARIAKLLGASVNWDNDAEELTIHTALSDEIVVGNRVPVVYFNDVRYRMDALPLLRDDRLYMPVRQLADMLHAELTVDAQSDTVEVALAQPAFVTEEKGLDEISQEAGISKAQLLKRNGLNSEADAPDGTKLKVVIPSFFSKPAAAYTEADLTLLAKITMVEAGYESYEGQLALANVILNRVKDTRFPDSIKEVIYSGRQFPPAHNGLLARSTPHSLALRAAKDALNGRNNIGDAVYFYNPQVTRGEFWSSLDVVVKIGHHSFAK